MNFATELYLERFSAALITEIKAEMGRHGIRSTRELGRLIGKSSSYMSDRLDGGSPKTGRRVILNVKDLAAIASALSVDPADLIGRAKAVADEGDQQDYPAIAKTAARKQPKPRPGE